MKTDNQAVLSGRNLVVVEIGGDWFKLLHVVRGAAGATVRRMILRRAEEAESLFGPGFLAALDATELRGMPAIVCLPRQAVNVRLFDLPSGDPSEIADMIDLQIARQTPYSREEIVFDYRLVGADKQGYTRVFLVIAQTALVRQKLRYVEECGLSVECVTVTTEGWLSALEAEGSGLSFGTPDPVAYLDVDASNADLLVAQKGIPLFSRSLSVGLKDLASRREKAEEDLLQQVVRAMETFRNENVSSNVSRLTVFGPEAKLAGLTTRLQEGLTMTVTPVSGSARTGGLPGDPRLDEMSVSGIMGAAAWGYGLQIDLMPDSMRLRKAVIVKARRLTLSVTLGMVILAELSLWVGSLYSKRAEYRDELERMIQATEQSAENVDAMGRKVELVADRMKGRMMPVRALTELHGITGRAICFTSIEINEKRQIVCRGQADTVGDVVKQVNAMESSPLFMNVKSTRTAAGAEKTDFEIAGDIEEARP